MPMGQRQYEVIAAESLQLSLQFSALRQNALTSACPPLKYRFVQCSNPALREPWSLRLEGAIVNHHPEED